MDALKRRAQAVLNDKSIDSQSRAIIRYALEINDPMALLDSCVELMRVKRFSMRATFRKHPRSTKQMQVKKRS